MASSKNYLPKSSAHNRSFTSAIARPSRRDFIRAFAAAGVTASFGGALVPQRLEANNRLRSINWKEVLGQFGDSVVIHGERDGVDQVGGYTMSEVLEFARAQQIAYCEDEPAYCEGPVNHATKDNSIGVPKDFGASVPLVGRGKSATSTGPDGFDTIYLPVGEFNNQKNAEEFAQYASDILGLSGKYSDLQMADENGELRPLLLSKQGVPVFFSAQELLFIYMHYRMNKASYQDMQFADTVLDYGGNDSASQARSLYYKRTGKVRAAGMNNLQKALHWMFVHHRFINERNDQSIDSTAPSENYDPMTEYWNEDGYWKGGRKISAEQSQARIRAMLAKDPAPLGNYGESALKWWSSTKFTLPRLKDSQGNEISAENPIDLANQLYPNDPLKAMMLIGNLQLELYFRYALKKKTSTRKELINTNSTSESKMANRLNRGIRTPREFLVESS